MLILPKKLDREHSFNYGAEEPNTNFYNISSCEYAPRIKGQATIFEILLPVNFQRSSDPVTDPDEFDRLAGSLLVMYCVSTTYAVDVSSSNWNRSAGTAAPRRRQGTVW
jgi:hypothetical protein